MPAEGFIRSIEVVAEPEDASAFPWQLPAVAALRERGLALDPAVTFLVGENGSGKSTLVEAFAVAAGLNAEGGSSGFVFGTRDSHSELWRSLRLVRGTRRPRTDFFLRAESLFTAASYLESLPQNPLGSYGGKSLHEQSHGESFLNLVVNRFEPGGFYVLDEPEAALSARGCLALIARLHDLVRDGAQVVLATHSPILVGFPGALVYRLSEEGIEEIDWDESDPVVLTRRFLADRDALLRHLIDG